MTDDAEQTLTALSLKDFRDKAAQSALAYAGFECLFFRFKTQAHSADYQAKELMQTLHM
jgi:hypothetical protein